jgi:aminoglycoside/choline kinase family phosphotransferase
MNFERKLVPIKGDASFRKFYRKKIKTKSSIIVYAEKEKIKNLLNYDSVNKLLLKENINAPKLLSEDFNKNLIEINDLGTKTIFDILRKKNVDKLKIYKKVLAILIKLQKISLRKIKNFKKKFYKIPIYSNKLIFNEANLFLDWYVPEIINKNKKFKIKKELKKIITSLIKKIKLPNTTFVHRDFHVSNLMIKKNKIFLIDSQDAVYGNIAYDLASLIDDVRLKTSKNFKEIIYQSYLNLNKKKLNKIKFKNDFEILSVLRNLKIIGIFTRLAKRDNKKKYLKLIPYAWKLIEDRIDNNVVFIDLKKKLENNFPKKIRIKK